MPYISCAYSSLVIHSCCMLTYVWLIFSESILQAYFWKCLVTVFENCFWEILQKKESNFWESIRNMFLNSRYKLNKMWKWWIFLFSKPVSENCYENSFWKQDSVWIVYLFLSQSLYFVVCWEHGVNEKQTMNNCQSGRWNNNK